MIKAGTRGRPSDNKEGAPVSHRYTMSLATSSRLVEKLLQDTFGDACSAKSITFHHRCIPLLCRRGGVLIYPILRDGPIEQK